MHKKNKRPVYLNLFKIRLPISGFVSIVHRVTGVMLVLFLPLSLYFLDVSLKGEEQFAQIRDWFSGVSGRISLGIVVWLFAQHFFSGFRHLLLDIDIGVDKATAHASSWITFVLSLITVVVLETVLWP
jgi:succinate dehydrogenase / fumarate reductase cytochrome b subunit